MNSAEKARKQAPSKKRLQEVGDETIRELKKIKIGDRPGPRKRVPVHREHEAIAGGSGLSQRMECVGEVNETQAERRRHHSITSGDAEHNVTQLIALLMLACHLVSWQTK